MVTEKKRNATIPPRSKNSGRNGGDFDEPVEDVSFLRETLPSGIF
jgi:hypothetical protein